MNLAAQWESLMGVLQTVAPATAASFQPGASARSIDRAEAATGCVWPAELKEWFSVQNGQVDPAGGFAGELLAHQSFFSLDRMLEERQVLLDVSQQIAERSPDLYEPEVARDSDAGAPTELFLPSYVPISGEDSFDNFCDTRPGALTGCVSFWAYDTGGHAGPPLWSSISEMLAAIDGYITNDPPEGWVFVVEDGAIHWEIDDGATSPEPTKLVYAPGFENVPNHTITPSWPEIPFNLPDNAVAAIRARHVAREQSVDLIAVQQAVMDDAARKYNGRVTAIDTHGMYGGYSLPRIPGEQLTVLVAIEGRRKMYIATATDAAGGFVIEDQQQDWT